MDRLQQLEDRFAILELKARYFRAVDTHDWELLESLFVPDAKFTGKGGFDTVGAADWVGRVRSFLEGGWSSHHGHTPEVTIDGDAASGIWAMEDYVGLPTGDIVHGYGHYADTYVRTADGWRIASMILTRLREERLPAGSVTQWVPA